MARDWTLSLRGKVPVKTWFDRIGKWRDVWKHLLVHRARYRDAIDLKLPYMMPVSKDPTGPASTQTDVYWFKRAHDLYMAQLYDPTPEIRRDVRGTDEADIADFEEVFLTRVAYEAGTARESRPIITDNCWAGFGFLWAQRGVWPQNLGSTEGAAVGAGDAVDAVLAGDYEPHPDQDHLTCADALEAVVQSPETSKALNDQQIAMLLAAAGQHRRMDMEKERTEPAPLNPDERAILDAWSPPGWTYWDPMALDIRHSRWMGRKIVMPVEKARALPFLRPSARAKIEAQPVHEEAKREGGIPRPSDSNAHDRADDDAGQAVLIEIYDRINRAHHFINERVDEYLEKDENYPYPDPNTGDPAIPGFFPCTPFVFSHPPTTNGERAFGAPLLAPGWPQQEAAVKFHSKMIDGAMRTVRIGLCDPQVPVTSVEAFTSGIDMNLVPGAQGTSTSLPLDQQVHFPTIPPLPDDWPQVYALLQQAFFDNVGVSPQQMTMTSGSETATEADIIAEAAATQVSDVGAQMEVALAHHYKILRAMARFYTPEEVAKLVGKKYTDPRPVTATDPATGMEVPVIDPATGKPATKPSIYEEWKAQSTDGDEIRVRLASRARDEDPVRVQAIEKALTTVLTVTDSTGAPMVSDRTRLRLIREQFRALNLGEPEEPSPEEKMRSAQARMAMTAGTGPGAQGGGGPPKGGADDRGEGGEPTRGGMNGRARTVARA